jgi:hypothetical protein
VKARSLRYRFELSATDIDNIQRALRSWGKPSEVVDTFNGATLYNYFERWETFVDTDWAAWDVSEYDHDLGCRVWIQVAIEHASATTREALERAVGPLDARFKERMAPAETPRDLESAPLSHKPYFWQSNTLHPDEAWQRTL